MLDAIVLAASDVQGQNEFFTSASLATLAGATAGSIAVGQVARQLLNLRTLWVPFIAAVAICFITAQAGGNLHSVADGLIVFLNSCLVFSTALGLNDGTYAATQRLTQAEVELQGEQPAGWPWLLPA